MAVQLQVGLSQFFCLLFYSIILQQALIIPKRFAYYSEQETYYSDPNRHCKIVHGTYTPTLTFLVLHSFHPHIGELENVCWAAASADDHCDRNTFLFTFDQWGTSFYTIITYTPPLLLKNCPIILALFSYANHLKNGPVILKLC